MDVKDDDCWIRELARRWNWKWIEPSKEDLEKTEGRVKNKRSKEKSSCNPVRLCQKNKNKKSSSSLVSRFQKEFFEGEFRGVKVFKRDRGADEAFRKEVRVLGEIGTHECIVRILGLSKGNGIDGCRYWMELMHSNLEKFLRKHLSGGISKPFSVTESKHILLEIARAMQYLHGSKVIHGDLKPANILVNPSVLPGGKPTVKVADFGDATFIESDNEVVYIKGTDQYAAPQVLKGRGTHESGTRVSVSDAKECDVYSFGIVAVEVLEALVGSDEKREDWVPRELGDDKTRSEGIKKRLEVIKKRVKAIRKFRKLPKDPLVDLVDRCLDPEPSNRPPFARVTRDLELIH